ncbi:pentatricopeptide repeat-containing protein mitochondrial [Dorcoceras hygrometricum]|uniref:Pentatricopeptide repeat-containing protein mitochondrial n=1 Tax=Dorcoceras hygrometricum TaxID=472368 RepID=A0A2Z7C7N4_9LAMI|nr:pentatricopeptide repeat-containing protein mitochondrial [Dorcoceras hygrometricum]
MSTGYTIAMKLATGSTVASDCSLRLDFLLYDVASLLRLDVQATCWYLATAGLNINLCKRHRFAIAISKYHLLVNSSLRLDFLLYDVASLLRLDVQATCWYLATAGLKPSAEYDDVTDDVINAKPSADSSARRRFISFSSLHLLIANC